MKVAIIGAGLAGLSCALECERLGVTADIFERNNSIGWLWPSMNTWPKLFTKRYDNDPIKYLKDHYNINIKAAFEDKIYIMKSPNKQVRIEGNLGYSLYRGKGAESIDSQLIQALRKTAVHYNSLSNYKELSKKYDYVVAASGRDFEAKELGVWEEKDRVSMMGTISLGSFEENLNLVYFDTEYAGSGYARLSPFSSTESIISLYVINKEEFNNQQLNINKHFERFLEKEKLDKLEHTYRIIKPPFSTGKVTKFKVGNVLLAGRSAGLTDRFLGTGGIEAIISGVSAARSIINGEDYDSMIKPLHDHIENLSTFRTKINKFDNDDFDKLISFIGTPGIKQMAYNTNINFSDMAGHILKFFDK